MSLFTKSATTSTELKEYDFSSVNWFSVKMWENGCLFEMARTIIPKDLSEVLEKGAQTSSNYRCCFWPLLEGLERAKLQNFSCIFVAKPAHQLKWWRKLKEFQVSKMISFVKFKMKIIFCFHLKAPVFELHLEFKPKIAYLDVSFNELTFKVVRTWILRSPFLIASM